MAVDAKIPTAIDPKIPPAPWHANTSRESSSRVLARQPATKLQTIPAAAPMIMDANGPTYPAAGVIVASAQTAPTEMPTADGLPFLTQSVTIQLIAPAAAARFVTSRALAAKPSAARALPALKPNQPNHNMAAPKITKGILLGLISLCGFRSFRLPMNNAAASADTPAVS